MNLVTGATGHIGNALVRELLRDGQRVQAAHPPDVHREAHVQGIIAPEENLCHP